VLKIGFPLLGNVSSTTAAGDAVVTSSERGRTRIE
jgi:hypothetical protein